MNGVAFGSPATDDRIVPDAIAAIEALGLPGGRGIRFDGPASLPWPWHWATQLLIFLVSWRCAIPSSVSSSSTARRAPLDLQFLCEID
jgi:hypothetical protein